MEILTYKQSMFSAEQLANELYELSQQAFASGSPWSVQQFLGDLCEDNKDYYLAVKNGQMLGYAAFQRIFEESELLNIAVLADKQHQKIGTKLLSIALQDQAKQNVEKVFLEVRVSNWPAQQLYQRHGFQEVNRRKQYYHQPVEDAVIMMALLTEGEENHD